jgi:hypothetical protein
MEKKNHCKTSSDSRSAGRNRKNRLTEKKLAEIICDCAFA